MANFSTEQRKQLALKKEAMPDGSYPIRNASDLKNAIQSYGRASDKEAVKEWIKKRAADLKLEDLLPETWKEGEEALAHYGILGQKWGIRRTDAQISKSKAATGSEDYKNAQALKKKGTKNLSTKELKDLTQRMQLEQQYKSLNKSDISKGMDVVKKITAAGTTIASLYALSKTPLAQDIKKAMTKAG